MRLSRAGTPALLSPPPPAREPAHLPHELTRIVARAAPAPAVLRTQAPLHGATAKAAREGLSQYFAKQSQAIKKQALANTVRKQSLHMTAAAANADLNKYFDSLQAHTKRGKLSKLAAEVGDLSKDVKAILQPVKQLQDSAAASRDAVGSLRKDTELLLKDEKQHQSDAEGALTRAEKAAESAADGAKHAASSAQAAATAAASKRARDETIVVRQALRRAPKTKYLKAKQVNPEMTVEGLPPHWKGYMDLRTKYAYFYNKRTGKSTWINPKGSRVHVKGLPAGYAPVPRSRASTCPVPVRAYWVSRPWCRRGR